MFRGMLLRRHHHSQLIWPSVCQAPNHRRPAEAGLLLGPGGGGRPGARLAVSSRRPASSSTSNLPFPSTVWTELFELEYLTYEVSSRRAEGQPNERMFYTQMPTEVDANAAAARFLRRRHPLAVDGVLGTEDAVLASSATPPGTIEDLPEKCVDYLFAFREIAEALDLGDGLNHEKRMIAISAPAIERWRSLTE